jgi:integrase
MVVPTVARRAVFRIHSKENANAKANAVDENDDELYPMKWNAEFIDAPVVDVRKQNTPSLAGEEVTKILAAIEAEMRTLFILDAATGLRAGELLGLEIRHFDGRSLRVEQSVWRSDPFENPYVRGGCKSLGFST